MFYAPSTAGFYDPAHPAIPADAREVTPDAHAALLLAQGQGATIQPGPDGQPVAIWPAAPTPVQTLAAARSRAHNATADWISELAGRYTNGLPLAEVASWPAKAEAAARHLTGDHQSMIVAEAAITGEGPDELARSILAKAALYTGIIARLTGLRRQTSAAIDAAASPEALQEVLLSARDQAETMLAQMGQPGR